MIKAIYRAREDGDYDFVAAFETEETPQEPSNWPEEIVEWLNSEGEETLVVENIALHNLTDVWSKATTPPQPTRQYRADDEDEDWQKELAAQLNRLMTLANKLQQRGETEAMQDVDSAISRIAEFEGIQLARTNETANDKLTHGSPLPLRPAYGSTPSGGQ